MAAFCDNHRFDRTTICTDQYFSLYRQCRYRHHHSCYDASTSTVVFYTANNTQLAPPSTGLGGLTVLWNRSGGQAEVNFYNVYDNAPISYIFSQKTGASAYNDLMYLWGNGNVGIGTINNGSNKLAVEGTIGARKVVVTATNPFPDYVFDRGYVLPSLRSLSSYIRVHHHLPELPSADSVARGGLDLGGNQTVLVKKIEELTLYIIGQDRELQELKKE